MFKTYRQDSLASLFGSMDKAILAKVLGDGNGLRSILKARQVTWPFRALLWLY